MEEAYKMLLYHGSNILIENIDLTKCRNFKDFGRGFYLTTLLSQAKQMAIRTSARFGGSSKVTAFEFDENAMQSLNIKVFEGVSDDCAEMILNNRDMNFKDLSNPLSNHDNKYDMVVGPVANDDISRIFSLYVNGIIRLDQLRNELEYKKLNNQYSFHTTKAISYLKNKGEA